ncbi:hypothetical protein N7495_001244 [Penicillium taxi]|uniref:uncharacterized protein n=1 Tax=Penicillium taxi TaxID=168475 RepID=UPI002544FA21|nr:uncharacterized protein N7495_001244 [Penicillium taxi]KAJ5908562.1 hypothetical protein N7495_001244 [Penicillium taxi]
MPADRDNKDNCHDSNSPQDETNPFVAICRFADEQVSSVLQSITGLPSSITPPRSDHWTIFTDDKGYKSMAYRQRNGTTSADPAGDRDYSQDRDESSSSGDREENSYGEKKSNTPRTSWTEDALQGIHSNEFFGLHSLLDRFEDFFSPGSPSRHTNPSFLLSDMVREFSPTWPVLYLMFSSYSPLNLERETRLRPRRENGVFMSSVRTETDKETSEPQWREAFEDLLRLQNGKPMLERDALMPKTTRESGNEWIRQMIKRRSWGDQWIDGEYNHSIPRLELRERTPKEESQNGREAETELELYERFLQDIESLERGISRDVIENTSPLLRALFAERQAKQDKMDRFRGRFQNTPQTEYEGDYEAESWIDAVSGGNRRTVPETEEALGTTPAVSSTDIAESETASRRVISTMSRTERTRLPDGSVQIKKVSTKRYDDGTEETDSSTELTNAHPEHKKSDGSGSQSKNGWFWRE